jgi:hypothetical protein
MTLDYSERPFDGKINVWRRESTLHPWILVKVVAEVSDAWAYIAGERRRRFVWHGEAAA